MNEEHFSEAVVKEFPQSDELRELINYANSDLYYGVLLMDDVKENYPNIKVKDWSDAVSQIRKHLECDEVADCWYDNQTGELIQSLDEAERRMHWEDEGGEWHVDECHEVYEIPRRDILSELLGTELARYV